MTIAQRQSREKLRQQLTPADVLIQFYFSTKLKMTWKRYRVNASVTRYKLWNSLACVELGSCELSSASPCVSLWPAVCVTLPGVTRIPRFLRRFRDIESDLLNILIILMLARSGKFVTMSDMSLAVVERESHLISIYTVLKIGYTKMMKKKVFFSERD